MDTFATYTRVKITGDGLTGRIGTIVDVVDEAESEGIPSYWVELDPEEEDRPASEMTYPVRAEHLQALTGLNPAQHAIYDAMMVEGAPATTNDDSEWAEGYGDVVIDTLRRLMPAPAPCPASNDTGTVMPDGGKPLDAEELATGRELFPCPKCRPADYAAVNAAFGVR